MNNRHNLCVPWEANEAYAGCERWFGNVTYL